MQSKRFLSPKAPPGLIGRDVIPAYTLVRGVRSSADAIEEADSARDEGRWAEAAQKYRRAALALPDRTDLKIQLGNCLKEAGEFRQSFDAYTLARAQDSSTEAILQIGHLLKVTGNFHAMEFSYRTAAAHGNGNAQGELERTSSLTGDAVRFPGSSRTPISGENFKDAFRDLSSCELGATPEPSDLRKTGAALAAVEENAVARAFFQLAFLLSPRAGAKDAQVDIVLRHPDLWPHGHIVTLLRVVSPPETNGDARQNLERLAIAALDHDSFGDPSAAEAARSSNGSRKADEFHVVTRDGAAVFLSHLCRALDEIYQLTVLGIEQPAAAYFAALRRIRDVLGSEAVFVSLFEDGSRQDLRTAACRVLANCMKRWLYAANAWSHVADEYPELAKCLAETDGNPLAARIAELESADAVLLELSAFLNGASTRGTHFAATAASVDETLSRIMTVCLPELPAHTALAFLDAAGRRKFDVTVASIAEKLASLGKLTDNEIIGLAQTLKTSGKSRLALALLERHFDDETISSSALVEKGIIAKICGDFALAARSFERCAAQEPHNDFARRELIAVLPEVEDPAESLARFQNDPLFMELALAKFAFRRAVGKPLPDDDDERAFSDGVPFKDLVPELVREFIRRPEGDNPRESIRIINAGWLKRRTLEGVMPLLRACEFVRAEVSSRAPLAGMRARIDGKSVGWASPSPFPAEPAGVAVQRTVFNCWMDLTGVAAGRHELQLYFEERSGGYRTFELAVWIDPTPRPQEEFSSPATIALPAETQSLPVDERIKRLPSVVFNARRRLFDGRVRKILVVRADQLGDAVASLSAMIRLKKLFPEASLSCLAAPANRDFFLSANIFDEIFEVVMDYDSKTRLRRISPREQARLAQSLSARAFDLAIDLSSSLSTRPLLRLAKARYTAGFGPREFPWLTFGIDLQTHECVNGHHYMPHASMPLALVEVLASMTGHQAFVLSNPQSDRRSLESLGLDDGRRFAVVHTGARTASRKWPIRKFVELARMMTQKADLHTVFLVDHGADLGDVSGEDLPLANFQMVVGHLEFEKLDSLLTHCSIFIGNDTGPKHLAALRGAPVVSLHMGAVNWNEWGQDGSGVIITRRVPCYGCGIEAIEECGKDRACLVDITPEEVMREVLRILRNGDVAGDSSFRPHGPGLTAPLHQP
jgi:ADP-heptose:LPS heptosyltransferase/tetratricopeptide (TPR) repeat protein